MSARCPKHIVCAAALLAFCFASAVRAADDPLLSWNDGPAKQQIVDFVNAHPKLLLNDNDAGKPEDIHFMIGQRPHAAFGNR
jgi:hypothetical protein